MSNNQFDDLTRDLASGISRRKAFKGIVVALAAGMEVGAVLRPARCAAANVGPETLARPDYLPTANGCGTGVGEPAVPDTYKKADFTGACHNHDICYGTCKSQKAECDYQFAYDLR